MRSLSLLCLVTFLLTSCSLLQKINPFGGSDDATTAGPPPPPPLPAPKKRILVMPFLNRVPFGGESLTNEVDELIRETISQCMECVIVSETELAGHETFTQQGAFYNFRALFEAARAQDIAGIILGSIDDLSIVERGDEVGIFRSRSYTANITMHYRLINAATEKDIVAKTLSDSLTEDRLRLPGDRTLSSEDVERGKRVIAKALEGVLRDFPQDARKLAWRGRIAKIDLHRYYINAGEETGISLGALLKVSSDGELINDPQSGAALGVAPGRFKGLLRVVDYLGKDGAVAVLHSGGGFRENDNVQLFSPPQE